MATFNAPTSEKERGEMYSLGLIDSSGNPTAGNSFTNSNTTKANTNASSGNTATMGNSGSGTVKTQAVKTTSSGSTTSNKTSSGTSSNKSSGSNAVYDTSHDVKINGRTLSGEEAATYNNLMKMGRTAWQRGENAADYWAKAAAMTGNDNWGLYTYNNGIWTATGKTDNGGQAGVKANAGGSAGSQYRITNPSNAYGAQYTFAEALNDAANNNSQTSGSSGTAKATTSGSGTVKAATTSYAVPLDDYLQRHGTGSSSSQVYSDSALSRNAQNIINQAKQEWQDAYNRGDQAGMNAARWKAEKARNDEGYYTSADGTGLQRLTDAVRNQRISENSNAWFGADPTQQNLLHEQNEYYRGQMGYSGGADGSQRITLNATSTVPTTNPYNNQQIPDYTGMTPQEKYAAAQAAGDTYGMAEAADEAFKERWAKGYYGGADGNGRTNLQPVLSNISQLQTQLSDATSRNDAKAATAIQQQIKDAYASIGMVLCEDGQVLSRTSLNLRIEQDKKDWWTKTDAGDYAGAQASHEDAVWCSRQLGFDRNQDGTVLTPLNSNMYSINNQQNELVSARVENGNPVQVLNPDGSVNTDYRGLLSMSGTDAQYQQYIVTTGQDGSQVFVPVTGTPTDFLRINPDGSLSQNRVTDAQGNVLMTDRFVFGADDRTYDKTTGKTLTELASEYGLDGTNFVQEITASDGSTRYFNLYGEEVTDRFNAAQREDVQDYENDTLNDMTNQSLSTGFNNVPNWFDYPALTWDQALAMAEEQVNGAYSQNLDKQLDKLNTNALQTGFYGQLPTEQLRQNATAETEVARQQAVYELANQIMADSREEAQRQYEDSMTTTQQRLNTVMTIFQQVYQMLRDKVSDSQQEENFAIQREGLDIQRDQNAITQQANYLNWLTSSNEGLMALMGYVVSGALGASEYANTSMANQAYGKALDLYNSNMGLAQSLFSGLLNNVGGLYTGRSTTGTQTTTA